MTTVYQRDDIRRAEVQRRAPRVSADAARERMIERQIAAAWEAGTPAAGGLRQDAAPRPRMVSAETARDRMIARQRGR